MAVSFVEATLNRPLDCSLIRWPSIYDKDRVFDALHRLLIPPLHCQPPAL